MQNEIENLKKRDADMGLENEKQYNELNLLRYKIKELEDELKTSEGKASNLQLAVRDQLGQILLHLNSFFAFCMLVKIAIYYYTQRFYWTSHICKLNFSFNRLIYT